MSSAPLLFESRLGGLFPANRVAEEAMREITGKVAVKITGGKANQRRRSLYWVLTSLVVPILNDQHNLTLDENDLHDLMRVKLKMYDEHPLPSGDSFKKLWSTSNRAMNEADRATYLNRCVEVWSKWLGVPVETLLREGENSA